MERDLWLEEEAPAIGIDLGTTNSCVAVCRPGGSQVEIIVNDQGNRITPSVVAFTPYERLVGDGAKNQPSSNAENTIFGVKRLIGRRFSDEIVKNDAKLWPFQVVGENDKPFVVVNYKGAEKHFCAEEISSMLLSKLKQAAETYFGNRPVKRAVVTVPAYFNNSQRMATLNAANIAGFSVVEILNEPTAAAIAYSSTNKDLCRSGRRRILVFDLGGGTFDISILEMDEHGNLDVKATFGDTHLGGEDFDNRMIQHLVMRHKLDIGEKRAIARLRAACERAKEALSNCIVTTIEVYSLCNGLDFRTSITRAKFEDLNSDLFSRCIQHLEQCLRDARMEKRSIQEVILVGGSTRIPKIRELVKEFFDGKELCHSIHEDEAVAYGAAVKASSLNPRSTSGSFRLRDVTPLSLGFKSANDNMHFVIPRNTQIPHCNTELCRTSVDNQTSVMFEIYEGEMEKAAQNHRLGYLNVCGLRPLPAGFVKFRLSFDINKDGILNVSAVHLNTGTRCHFTFTGTGELSQEEIARMVEEANRFRLEDDKRKKADIARNDLEKYASGMERAIRNQNMVSRVGAETRRRLESQVQEVRDWLEECQHAEEHEVAYRREVLNREWEPIKSLLKRAGVRDPAFDI